jgi:hypothetical protein
MSNYVPQFGNESGSLGTNFIAGINEDVTMQKFEYVSENNNEYVQLEFEKEGSQIRDRIYIPKDPRPMKKKGGEMESADEAMIRDWGDVNTKIKHIITNYVSEEEFHTKFQTAAPKSFKDFILFCERLLPNGWKDMKGELIVSYNTKGFLSIPFAMWVTGHFFSVNGAKSPLRLSSRLVLVRPGVEEDSEEAEAAVPVAWIKAPEPAE